MLGATAMEPQGLPAHRRVRAFGVLRELEELHTDRQRIANQTRVEGDPPICGELREPRPRPPGPPGRICRFVNPSIA